MSDTSSGDSFIADYDEEKIGEKDSSYSPQKLKTNLYLFHNSSLRLHDNPSLLKSIYPGKRIRAVFIFDVYHHQRSAATCRNRFLLESLHNIDQLLRNLKSRLYVIRGHPVFTLDRLIPEWNVDEIFFEAHVDKGGILLDQSIISVCREKGVSVTMCHSHTLYDPDQLLSVTSSAAMISFNLFEQVLQQMGPPRSPLQSPGDFHDNTDMSPCYNIPDPHELGVDSVYKGMWVGGESEGLKRLETYMEKRVPTKGTTTFLDEPTAISPYVRFGCLSTKFIYRRCRETNSKDFMKFVFKKLSMRDFYLHLCSRTPNFEVMEGNPLSLHLPWESDHILFDKWRTGRTGYPLIDAAMIQLVQEGFIHHSLREMVASFLTKGDLWISWVRGKDVFAQYLLDYEPGICSGSWMKSSCSAFIGETIEHYHPVGFGQKVDPEGIYVRRYLPQLKDIPSKYIYCPWATPLSIQHKAGCIIGRDYPFPIVDHLTASTICSERLKITMNKFYHEFKETASTIKLS